jgi:hypothetical protein
MGALTAWMLGMAVAAAPPSSAEVPGDWPGDWALRIDVVGERSAPLLGELRMRTTTLAHVRVAPERSTAAREGAAAAPTLMAVETACEIVSDARLFTSRAPPELIRQLPPERWAIESDGAQVAADLGRRSLGFVGRTMPASAGDPRVRDPDGNGRPGASMKVEVLGLGSLDLDVLGRWHIALAGARVSPGRVEGHVKAQTEEKILFGLPLPGELGPLEVDERASRFVLVRLEGPAPSPGAERCAAVLRAVGGERHSAAP